MQIYIYVYEKNFGFFPVLSTHFSPLTPSSPLKSVVWRKKSMIKSNVWGDDDEDDYGREGFI